MFHYAHAGSQKAPSLMGSRQSVYSHTSSTVRITRAGTRSKRTQQSKIPWYRKPIMKSAIYTDLQRGAWHIGLFTMFLSLWTIFTSGFDVYCLHEATPGSNHTGYYIISFDFVYVGNIHVRNLLLFGSVFSLLGGCAVLVSNVLLLDGLRKEQEKAFKGWLYCMGFLTVWKIITWVYNGIVNDPIFAYNYLMLIIWFFLNIMNVFSWLCIYSLYLELDDLTKIQDMAKLKMDTMSSMAPSRATSSIGGRDRDIYGQRTPAEPQYVVNNMEEGNFHQYSQRPPYDSTIY